MAVNSNVEVAVTHAYILFEGVKTFTSIYCIRQATVKVAYYNCNDKDTISR